VPPNEEGRHHSRHFPVRKIKRYNNGRHFSTELPHPTLDKKAQLQFGVFTFPMNTAPGSFLARNSPLSHLSKNWITENSNNKKKHIKLKTA